MAIAVSMHLFIPRRRGHGCQEASSALPELHVVLGGRGLFSSGAGK